MPFERVEDIAFKVDFHRANFYDFAAQRLLDPVIIKTIGLIADVPF